MEREVVTIYRQDTAAVQKSNISIGYYEHIYYYF